MPYFYLPKNSNEGSVTLEKIAKEFTESTQDPITSGVLCETVQKSWLDSELGITSDIRGICWGGTSGQYLFLADNATDTIYRIETPQSFGSALDTLVSPNIQSLLIGTGTTVGVVENSVQGIAFSPDGIKMFLIGDVNSLGEYILSTPWDLSTASYVQKFSLSSFKIREYAPSDIAISSDGTKIFIVGNYKDRVQIINLPNPYSLTGAKYNTYFNLVDGTGTKITNFPTSIAFNINGDVMYISGYDIGINSKIFQYDLEKAFDPTTAQYNTALDINTAETQPASLTYASIGVVTEYPSNIGNPYNVGGNLVVVGSSGLNTYALPIAQIATPVTISNFYRGEQFVPDADHTKGIPTKFDKTKINGFSDSAIENTILEYTDSFGTYEYETYGLDFNVNGNYIFTNSGVDSDTLIFRLPTQDKSLTNIDYTQGEDQRFSIVNQKLGGFTASGIYNTWYPFSHYTTNVFPFNSSEATNDAWELISGDTNIRNIPNSGSYMGLVNINSTNTYRLTGYASSTDIDNDTVSTIGCFAKYGEPEDSDYFEATLAIDRNIPGGSQINYANGTKVTFGTGTTFAIKLNGLKSETTFNAGGTALLRGTPANEITTQQPTTYTNWNNSTGVYRVEYYFEIIKENDEICFFSSPLWSANNWGIITHKPGGTSDGEWDWRNLTPASGVTNLKGVAYYLNLTTGSYSWKDFGAGTSGSGSLSSDQKVMNSLSLFRGGTQLGIGAFSQKYSTWYELTLNGVQLGTDVNLYNDVFASHRIAKGGYKLYTAVNTYNEFDSLYSSQILGYDMTTAYNLNSISYNGEKLSTYTNGTTLDNRNIRYCDFGIDSANIFGNTFYTLSDPSNDSPNIAAVFDQYSLENTWDITSAVKQYTKKFITSEINFIPKVFSFTDEGYKLITAGNSGIIQLGVLTEPYQINTLSYSTDSDYIFNTKLNDISSLWVSNNFDYIVAGGNDSTGYKLAKFENIGFLNSISFSNFFDSI